VPAGATVPEAGVTVAVKAIDCPYVGEVLGLETVVVVVTDVLTGTGVPALL